MNPSDWRKAAALVTQQTRSRNGRDGPIEQYAT